MKIALCVVGDGRSEYLAQTVRSVHDHVLAPLSHRVMVDDSGDLDYGIYLDETYPEFEMVHGGRRGMAGAVQAGWDTCLKRDPDYVLHIEEDMCLTRDLPVSAAVDQLESHPWVAQMAFRREPWHGSPEEMRHGDQLAAIVSQSPHHGHSGPFTWHDFLFTLNPCLIPASVCEMGWPSGPIGVGNESGMTSKLLEKGFVFGSWGHLGELPYAVHLGDRRSPGWAL